MKFESINHKFTEKVAEWIVKGYTINTASMGGSQGEVGKVDLTDGKEIIRILLDNFGRPCERIGDRYYSLEGVKLIVGRVTDKVIPNSPDTWSNVWNEHLEILSCEEFYQIGRQHRNGSKWYGTKAEAMAQQEKSSARYSTRRNDASRELSDQAKEIVLPFIRRQPRCKTVRLSEIERVTKRESERRAGGRFGQYIIAVRGQTYTMK